MERRDSEVTDNGGGGTAAQLSESSDRSLTSSQVEAVVDQKGLLGGGLGHQRHLEAIVQDVDQSSASATTSKEIIDGRQFLLTINPPQTD